MIVAIWPVIVLIVGILLWVLPTPPVIKDMGRYAFFCGLLVTTLVLARQVLRIG